MLTKEHNRLKKVFVGCGAGFAGDRFDAATPVVETLAHCDGPRYLIYEVLAERSLAIAQMARRVASETGYSPYLEQYLEPILTKVKDNNIRIVTNMGAANPIDAAQRVHEIAKNNMIHDLKVSIVSGDNLLAEHSVESIREKKTIEGISIQDREIIAANAYLGAAPIVEALAHGADVVLVGRTTDVALTLGPLMHEFEWSWDDWSRLAQGTLAGHLLECGGQVTGAYFADPGFKDVPNLAEVGFPIAEINESGEIVITKANKTGGLVNKATVIEQALYEIHDPEHYLSTDVTLDLTQMIIEEVAENRVRVTGANGTPPPLKLKATISVYGGWLGEGEITYAGSNALARAELAASIIRKRCQLIGIQDPVRVDIHGARSVYDNDIGSQRQKRLLPRDGEYRVRAAVRSDKSEIAQRVSDEVLSLYCSGPAAGGGVRQAVSEQIRTASILIDREWVMPYVKALRVLA